MNGALKTFLAHPIVSALIVAVVVSTASWWKAGAIVEHRLASVEHAADKRDRKIDGLNDAITELTKATAVLSERMQGVINRIDERRAARARERERTTR